jgi:hypothetical protein
MAGAVSQHWAALRAASSAVFIAHLIKTAFAVALLGMFGLDLTGVASRGDLVEVASFALQEAPRRAAAVQWTVCAYLLVGPLLTQFVLAALLRRPRPQLAAMWRYGLALGLSMLRFSVLGVAGAGVFALSTALAQRVPAELETAARLVPIALGAALIPWLSTMHDVAAARLAVASTPRALDALQHGARETSAKLIATHVLLLLAATVCYALGETASRLLWPSPGFAIAQALALTATFVNAAWLSVALAQTNQPTGAGLNEPASNNQPELTGQ